MGQTNIAVGRVQDCANKAHELWMLSPKPHGRSPCLPSSGVVRQSRDRFRRVASMVDDVGDCQKSLESALLDRRESDFRHEETG